MKITPKIDEARKLIVLTVQGELDVHQAKVLRAAVQDLLRDGDWQYEFDFAQVGYLDSSGLGMLVFLQKEMTRRGGRMRLTHLQEGVMKVFEITKLHTFFHLEKAGGEG